MITAHDRWELVDIYADEGITGTSAKKRKDFQRLLADCRKGRIDKVLVKSISRFARNTTECLETIRELKSLGISIYFEEHNIDTKMVSSEMLTAVIASCAQAESESISRNMRWSVQKRMENGTFNTCRAATGFQLSENGLKIAPEEAPMIYGIYADYLQGKNSREIAARLNAEAALGRTWNRKLVDYILTNERYAGNALLQKKYRTDSFPRMKKPFEEKKKEITDYLRNFTEDSHADALADIAGEEQRCQILNQKFWGAGNVISAGNRITMRRVQESDREGYLEIKRAYLVTKHMLKEPTYCNMLWEEHIASKRLTLSIHSDGSYIGYCGIKNLLQEPWEIGIELRPEWTRRGIGYRAVSAMLKEIQTRFGVHVFCVRIEPRNLASQRLFEKLGAVPDGLTVGWTATKRSFYNVRKITWIRLMRNSSDWQKSLAFHRGNF